MPSETLHSSHLAHQPGETTTESGIVVPAPRPNVRETISLEDIQQAKADKESNTTTTAESAYDKFVLGGEQAPVSAEVHTAVLEHVTSELDSQSNEIEGLHAENAALKDELAALKRQIAELKGEKFLAADQPRRVRKQNGVTEKLVKYEDGSYAWDTIRVDEDYESTQPEDEAPAEAAVELSKADVVEASADTAEEAEEPKDTKEDADSSEDQPATPGKELELFNANPDKAEVVVGTSQDNTPENTPAPENGASQTDTAVLEAQSAPVVAESAAEAAGETDADQADVETSEKKASRGERIKGWFKKELRHLQEFGGVAYFADLARRTGEGAYNATFNAGVHSGLTDWEKKEKQDRNRRYILAGVGALAVYAIYKGIDNNFLDGNGAADAHAHTGAMDTHVSTHEAVADAQAPADTGESIKVLEFSDDTPPSALDVDANVAGYDSLPNELYNIPEGGSGEQLLSRLQIDPSKWYSVENSLIDQFPDDFYRMADGHVGIIRPGFIPQGAQDIIETLR